MTFSMVKAPPRREALIGWMGYGSITGARSYPRGRLWVLAESATPATALSAMIAWNHPHTGRATYEDLGAVTSMRIHAERWVEVTLVDGSKVGMVVASCVCGAGAVGYAPPGEDNPRVAHISLHGHPQVTAE